MLVLDERLELQRFPFDRQMFGISAEFINAKLVDWVRARSALRRRGTLAVRGMILGLAPRLLAGGPMVMGAIRAACGRSEICQYDRTGSVGRKHTLITGEKLELVAPAGGQVYSKPRR